MSMSIYFRLNNEDTLRINGDRCRVIENPQLTYNATKKNEPVIFQCKSSHVKRSHSIMDHKVNKITR